MVPNEFIDFSGFAFVVRLIFLLSAFVLAGTYLARATACTRIDGILHALCLGHLAVSLSAYFIGFFLDIKINLSLLALCAIGWAIVGRALFHRLPPAPKTWRGVHFFPLALGLAAATLSFFQHDEYLALRGSCFPAAILDSGHPYWSFAAGLSFGEHQQIANPALATPFYTALGIDGLRWVSVYAAFIGAVYLYLLGFRLFRRQAWGFLFALVGVFSPYYVQIPTLDENQITLMLCAIFLFFFLREPLTEAKSDAPGTFIDAQGRLQIAAIVFAGFAYGAYLSSRYIQFLTVPAALYYLWKGGDLRQRFKKLGLFFLPMLPYLILIAINQLEGYYPFDEPLFNFPFGADEWIRTAFKPYPTSLFLPLYLTDHFGIALTATALLGFVALAASKHRTGLFICLFVLPAPLLISFMELWLKPNKNGIPLMLIPAACIALGYGAHQLIVKKNKRYLFAFVGVCAAIFFGAAGLRTMSWKVIDAEAHHEKDIFLSASEEAPYSAFEKELISSPGLLSNFSQYSRYSSPFAWWKLRNRQPWQHDPWCVLRPSAPRPRRECTENVWLIVDINEPFTARNSWVRLQSEPPAPDMAIISDLSAQAGWQLSHAYASWTRDAMRMALLPCGETVNILRTFERGSYAIGELHTETFLPDDGFDLITPFHSHDERYTRHKYFTIGESGLLAFTAKSVKRLVFMELLSNYHELAVWWQVDVDCDKLTIKPAQWYWSP